MKKINKIREGFLKYLYLEYNLEQISQKIHNYFLYPDELEIEMKKKRIRFTPKKLEDLSEKLEDSVSRINPLLNTLNENINLIDEEIFNIYELKPEHAHTMLTETI